MQVCYGAICGVLESAFNILPKRRNKIAIVNKGSSLFRCAIWKIVNQWFVARCIARYASEQIAVFDIHMRGLVRLFLWHYVFDLAVVWCRNSLHGVGAQIALLREHLTLDSRLGRSRHIGVREVLGYFIFLPATELIRLLALNNSPHRDFSASRSIRAEKRTRSGWLPILVRSSSTFARAPARLKLTMSFSTSPSSPLTPASRSSAPITCLRIQFESIPYDCAGLVGRWPPTRMTSSGSASPIS